VQYLSSLLKLYLQICCSC
ncbi:unnamed protein product, partial [Allacma fusca]